MTLREAVDRIRKFIESEVCFYKIDRFLGDLRWEASHLDICWSGEYTIVVFDTRTGERAEVKR